MNLFISNISIEMAERITGEKAIKKLNKTRVHMQSIFVNEACPRNGGSSSGFGCRRY